MFLGPTAPSSAFVQNQAVFGPPAPQDNANATSVATGQQVSIPPTVNATSAQTGQPTYSAPPQISVPAPQSVTQPAPQPASTPVNSNAQSVSTGQPVEVTPSGVDVQQQQLEDEARRAAEAAAEAERQRVDALNTRFTEGVTQAFNPIFSSLDKQIGIEQSELDAARTGGIQAGTREAQIESQFGTDLRGIQDVRDTSIAGLGGLLTTAQDSLSGAFGNIESQAQIARDRARAQTQTNLQDLDENTRNLSTSALRRLGAAGDSSAAIAVQRALGVENLRQRGRLIGMRDEVMAGIENTILDARTSLQDKFNTIKFGIEEKKNEVQTVFAQNKARLEGWKQEQLSNLVNTAQERISQLEAQRAQASQEQQSQILNLQIQTEQNLMNRLSGLDDEVRNLSTGLDQWALQRSAAIDDYARQLAQAAQYSGGTSVSAPNLQFKTVPIGATGQETSLAFNPQTGQLTNPLTGYIVDPRTGQEYDPNTGLPKNVPVVTQQEQERSIGDTLLEAGAGLQRLLGLT